MDDLRTLAARRLVRSQSCPIQEQLNQSTEKAACHQIGQFDQTHAEAEPVTFEEEVYEAAIKFEDEFLFSKMDEMIHRFPSGLGGISSSYPSMVVPRFVAIGPYHHGKKHLKKMEAVKKAAAHYLFQGSEKIALDDVKAKVLAEVDNVRAKYFADETGTEEGMMMDKAHFADMMICDACFLLLYMDAYNRSYGAGGDDYEVNESMRRFLFSNRDSINNDIMLLENQLPWPVIQVIMDLASDLKLKEAVGKFIARMGSSFKIRESSKRETYQWHDKKNPPHLLALLRRYKTKKHDDGDDDENNSHPPPLSTTLTLNHPLLSRHHPHSSTTTTIHASPTTEVEPTSISAISPMDLEQIGIELTASSTAKFSDMGLEGGWVRSRLTLAPLCLGDTRASCLVNMAAFEVCTASRFGDDRERTAVCSYLALLALFMVGSEDVRKLRSMSLLNGPGSDDDMLTFFKTLMNHLPDYGTNFAIVMRDIEKYRENRPIRTTVYKWLYNNYVTIIKVATVLATLIGLYQAFLSLVQKN